MTDGLDVTTLLALAACAVCLVVIIAMVVLVCWYERRTLRCGPQGWPRDPYAEPFGDREAPAGLTTIWPYGGQEGPR